VRRNGNDGRKFGNSEPIKANCSYLPAFDLAIFCAMDSTNPRSHSSIRLNKPRDLARAGELTTLPSHAASKFKFS
jgi:hypothetical protein